MIDKRIVELTHQFCMQHLAQHGYMRLYLIGSRARGTAKPTSDHDFVAVVKDGTPNSLLTGQNTQLLAEFARSEEHTSELQSLMRISYAVFCLKKNINTKNNDILNIHITTRQKDKHQT